MPMVWGILRGRMMLPSNADDWSIEQLRQVIVHELAHLKRRDQITLLLGRIAKAVFWYNPLAWHAFDQMTFESENACDDFVLRSGREPADYAALLLKLSTQPNPAFASPVSVSMAKSLQVERRIKTILERNQNRNPIKIRLLIPSLAIAISLTGVIAVLAAGQKQVAKTFAAEPSLNRLEQGNDESSTTEKTPSAPAQKAVPPAAAQKRGVGDSKDDVLLKTIKRIESAQLPDGSWTQETTSYNTSALATLALIRAGKLADADCKKRAIESLSKAKLKLGRTRTYTISLQTIALCEADHQLYAKKIQSNLNWLCKQQAPLGNNAGGWSYGMHPSSKPNIAADGSNTRFAVWALTVAQRKGFKVPKKNLKLAARYWLDSQQKSGGWSYYVGTSTNTRTTMTLSGIACLSMLKRAIEGDKALHKQIDAAVVKAWNWPGLDGKLKANTTHVLCGWQVYSLACQVTDWETDQIGPKPVAVSSKIFDSIKTMQKLNGDFKPSLPVLPSDISNSLAIIALSSESK